MKLPTIMSADGRRAWAFAAIVGGCVTFTVFAAVGVYLVRKDALLAFYLALAAHVQILVGMTALGWTMGRRMILSAGKDGLTASDAGPTIKVEQKVELPAGEGE